MGPLRCLVTSRGMEKQPKVPINALQNYIFFCAMALCTKIVSWTTKWHYETGITHPLPQLEIKVLCKIEIWNLVGVLRVFAGCLNGVRCVSAGYKVGVWRLEKGCLKSVDIFWTLYLLGPLIFLAANFSQPKIFLNKFLFLTQKFLGANIFRHQNFFEVTFFYPIFLHKFYSYKIFFIWIILGFFLIY